MPRGKEAVLKSYLLQEVDPHWLASQLYIVTFATGLLDAISYGTFYVFSSNQTGNVINLLSLSLDLRSRYANDGGPSILTVGTSLASFITFAFIAGRIGLKYGHRLRWWLLLSTSAQCILLLITAVLMQGGVLSTDDQHARPTHPKLDAIPVALLAIAAGLQVSQARTSGVNEVPTAMLTSPMVDFLVHPNLLTRQLRSHGNPGIKSRNIRAIYIFCLVSGVVVGAAIDLHQGVAAATFTAFAVRFVGLVALMFIPQRKDPIIGDAQEARHVK
jgi:uncharacterized membrane protein YoaK (UPF0700 family)